MFHFHASPRKGNQKVNARKRGGLQTAERDLDFENLAGGRLQIAAGVTLPAIGSSDFQMRVHSWEPAWLGPGSVRNRRPVHHNLNASRLEESDTQQVAVGIEEVVERT